MKYSRQYFFDIFLFKSKFVKVFFFKTKLFTWLVNFASACKKRIFNSKVLKTKNMWKLKANFNSHVSPFFI